MELAYFADEITKEDYQIGEAIYVGGYRFDRWIGVTQWCEMPEG